MHWRRRINRVAFVLVLGAIAVWFATGRAIYTRFPDPRRTALAAAQQQDDNLWPTGTPTDTASRAATRADEFPNRFMLGLLPSGGGKYMLSVGSVALFCGVVVGATWVWQSINSKRSRIRVD